jgi:hypothetical protein
MKTLTTLNFWFAANQKMIITSIKTITIIVWIALVAYAIFS